MSAKPKEDKSKEAFDLFVYGDWSPIYEDFKAIVRRNKQMPEYGPPAENIRYRLRSRIVYKK